MLCPAFRVREGPQAEFRRASIGSPLTLSQQGERLYSPRECGQGFPSSPPYGGGQQGGDRYAIGLGRPHLRNIQPVTRSRR